MLLATLNTTIKKHKNKGLSAIDQNLLKLGPKLKPVLIPIKKGS